MFGDLNPRALPPTRNVGRVVHKPTTENRVSTITPTPDAHLRIQLDPGDWSLLLQASYFSPTAANGIRYKFVWSGVATAVSGWFYICRPNETQNPPPQSDAVQPLDLETLITSGFGQGFGVLQYGWRLSVSQPGEFGFSWAQRNSAASAVVLQVGSFIVASKILRGGG